jgi:hypothetical protein
MPWLVVVGLGLLVCYLARKAPGMQATTSLEADMTIPGTGASGVPSPAKANGSPYIAESNEIRLQTSYQYVNNDQKMISDMSPRQRWSGRDRVIAGGNYMTDAQSSLMTQDVPPVVQDANSQNTAGTKI